MAWKNKGRKAPHHMGTFHVASQRCRAMAYANPSQRCRRCGLTLTEIRQGAHGKPPNPKAKWTAGHVIDGQIGGRLEPECSPCSVRSGGELGRQQSRTNRQRTEWTW